MNTIYNEWISEAIERGDFVHVNDNVFLRLNSVGGLTLIAELKARWVNNNLIKETAMPEQEPVAYKYTDKHNPLVFYFTARKGKDVTQNPDVIETALYTAPPKREWVGLTDEEIKGILDCGRGGLVDIKKAEQILKEKNGG